MPTLFRAGPDGGIDRAVKKAKFDTFQRLMVGFDPTLQGRCNI